MRHLRIDVVAPPIRDDRIELATWSSGVGTVAAGRRLSLAGDSGGRVELDSVWVHLGPDAKPARIENFGVYEEASGGCRVTTRLELPEPRAGTRTRWPLRSTDVDLLGHVNNSAYWHAVEECLPGSAVDPRLPFSAHLDHVHPIDFGDELELVCESGDRSLAIAFVVGGSAKAVAAVQQGP